MQIAPTDAWRLELNENLTKRGKKVNSSSRDTFTGAEQNSNNEFNRDTNNNNTDDHNSEKI